MIADDDLLDGVSAEYALGTLRGPARTRMERMIAEDARVRAAAWRWESYLGGWAHGVPAQAPPARVWRNIQQRLQHERGAGGASWWNRWLLALPVTAVALLIAVLLSILSSPDRPIDHVAVFSNETGESIWVISASSGSGQLQLRAESVTSAGDNKVYELWLLPPDGTPRSLGLLPEAGSTQRQLPEATVAVLQQTRGLAVSVEPSGGSPTGLPTGPVVYQAALTRL